jgi:hypothetical protein
MKLQFVADNPLPVPLLMVALLPPNDVTVTGFPFNPLSVPSLTILMRQKYVPQLT